MHDYKVKSEQFNGPLDILLSMIEDQQLEITKVSLALVADQYIDYINSNPGIDPEEIADFLVIASKLILIKSKALLPSLVVEDEDAVDLEKQLKMYKLYLEATKKIEAIVAHQKFTYTHDKYPSQFIQGFVPPKKQITSERLRDIYDLLLKRIEPVVVLPKKIIERVVTIREKIQQIRDRILSQARLSFRQSVLEGSSVSERIVSFLAVLELVKQRIIDVEQDNFLSDIHIFRSEGAESREVVTETDFI